MFKQQCANYVKFQHIWVHFLFLQLNWISLHVLFALILTFCSVVVSSCFPKLFIFGFLGFWLCPCLLPWLLMICTCVLFLSGYIYSLFRPILCGLLLLLVWFAFVLCISNCGGLKSIDSCIPESFVFGLHHTHYII
jgi:hypothetical protein